MNNSARAISTEQTDESNGLVPRVAFGVLK